MALTESHILTTIARLHQRSALQRNSPGETDAELIAWGNDLLAITIDTLQEEIRWGFFRQPYTIGWYSQLISLSDLAAVGASPIGCLNSYSLPISMDEAQLKDFLQGVEDCVQAHGAAVLGGDLNSDEAFSATCTALGICAGSVHAKRRIEEPSALFVTPGIGCGNAVALANTLQLPFASELEASLRPLAPLALGQSIAAVGGACMDSSDGFFNALHTLQQYNRLRIELSAPLPFHAAAEHVAAATRLPLHALALGEVGDYGLVFAIPHRQLDAFYAQTNPNDYVAIGQAFPALEVGVFLRQDDYCKQLDLNDLYNNKLQDRSPDIYIRAIVQFCLDHQL